MLEPNFEKADGLGIRVYPFLSLKKPETEVQFKRIVLWQIFFKSTYIRDFTPSLTDDFALEGEKVLRRVFHSSGNKLQNYASKKVSG